jgi:hypothetical protein
MSCWRITHIDAQRQRHVLELLAPSAEAADGIATALYGPALSSSCINLSRARG